jgi:hypothetical protein
MTGDVSRCPTCGALHQSDLPGTGMEGASPPPEEAAFARLDAWLRDDQAALARLDAWLRADLGLVSRDDLRALFAAHDREKARADDECAVLRAALAGAREAAGAMNDDFLAELAARLDGVRHGLYAIESKEVLGRYVCSADDIRRLIEEARRVRGLIR